MTDVVLTVNGILEASTHYKEYPISNSGVNDFLNVVDVNGFIMNGTGMVDGLGYDWWVREWKVENPHSRPKLMSW